jgi:hypothetical protein
VPWILPPSSSHTVLYSTSLQYNTMHYSALHTLAYTCISENKRCAERYHFSMTRKWVSLVGRPERKREFSHNEVQRKTTLQCIKHFFPQCPPAGCHSVDRHIVPYAPLHCTSLHSTALHCTTLHCTTLHCTTLHCTTQHCTTLHFRTLHCTTQHCTVLHCTYMRIHCPYTYCTYFALYCTALQ